MSRLSARGCRIASLVAVLQFSALAFGQDRAPSDDLVVHEWGTFTSLQDEAGNAIGGINADDEPVPPFVHRVNHNLVLRPQASAFLLAKSVPRSHPDVTMRLETPVVYFHPGPGAKQPFPVNIEVAFRGGWLSEFYPQADVKAPGINNSSFGPLTADTVGSLAWNDLQVGTESAGPETDSPVWLAPRAVDAANVTAAGGESERYLFYRGIGHVDSPIEVSRRNYGTSSVLHLTANYSFAPPNKERELVPRKLWLVDIRADKSCAFRELEGNFRIAADGRYRLPTSDSFDSSEFAANNTERLSDSMRTALIEDGLFADEADALLNTWRASYFETPGLRLFYLLPQEWTDHVMPMKLSVDAKLVRTMIGRVEIVTPQQRELLKQIAVGPTSTAEWMYQPDKPAKPPADYRAYQSLGRFRNALVLDELKRRPTEPLQAFIKNYGLAGYVPVVTTATEATETTAAVQ